jgi:hypothetical protein
MPSVPSDIPEKLETSSPFQNISEQFVSIRHRFQGRIGSVVSTWKSWDLPISYQLEAIYELIAADSASLVDKITESVNANTPGPILNDALRCLLEFHSLDWNKKTFARYPSHNRIKWYLDKLRDAIMMTGSFLRHQGVVQNMEYRALFQETISDGWAAIRDEEIFGEESCVPWLLADYEEVTEESMYDWRRWVPILTLLWGDSEHMDMDEDWLVDFPRKDQDVAQIQYLSGDYTASRKRPRIE